MILEKGNMWDVYEDTDLFCITTNSFVKGNGELVMGRGIALEALKRFPELPRKLGYEILKLPHKVPTKVKYHFIWYPPLHIAAFQVKYHYRDKAKIELIKKSCEKLKIFARQRPTWRIDLNFPGIGYGGLDKADVLPTLRNLPDNIHVWEFEDGKH